MARSRRWFLLRAAVFMVVFLPAWGRPVLTWRTAAECVDRIDWSIVVAAAWGAVGGMVLLVIFTALAIRAFCRSLVGA